MLRRGFESAGPHARMIDTGLEQGTIDSMRRQAALRVRARHALTRSYAGPTMAGIIAGALAPKGLVTVLVAVTFFLSAALAARLGRHSFVLPLMRHLRIVIGPLTGTVALVTLDYAFELNAWSAPEFGAMLLGGTAAGVAGYVAMRYVVGTGAVAKRIAVIGTAETTATIQREIGQAGIAAIEVVGRIGNPVTATPTDATTTIDDLGTVDELGDLVVRHHIDLLVLTRNAPRLQVFDEVTESCLELPVRLIDLTSFCERTFGHVPISEMNASWFQYLMHPSFRRRAELTKRAIDLVIATVAGLAFLPILAVVALLIRRDGGPVFFLQTRIGEGGRPFRIYKLRTMANAPNRQADWTTKDDPRITKIGHFLRKSHLDEFPQVLNVLKGDMTIVGPRPEQPSYVNRLERNVPFYSRRHLIKPGITGWAQIRCGYSGSVQGSAWKMCHDLYYVKHRSIGLDLLIIGETVRTLFADKQFAQEPEELSAFALAAPPTPDAALAR